MFDLVLRVSCSVHSLKMRLVVFFQMPREAAKGGVTSPSCKSEADGDEQAFDGRERQVAEAGVSTGV